MTSHGCTKSYKEHDFFFGYRLRAVHSFRRPGQTLKLKLLPSHASWLYPVQVSPSHGKRAGSDADAEREGLLADESEPDDGTTSPRPRLSTLTPDNAGTAGHFSTTRVKNRQFHTYVIYKTL